MPRKAKPDAAPKSDKPRPSAFRKLIGWIVTLLLFGGVFGGTAAMVGLPNVGRCQWLLDQTAVLTVTDEMVSTVEKVLEPTRPLVAAVGRPLIGQATKLCSETNSPYIPCSIPAALPVTVKLPFIEAEFVVTMVLLYVVAVFVLKLVFGLLHKIKAFKGFIDLLCKLPMLAYNVFLVCLSAFMAFGTLREIVLGNFTFWGNAIKPSSEETLARLVWIFYLSKIPEFLDTIFMILNGNMRQVSFLHVYHHGSVLGVAWLYVMYAPNGDTALPVFLNSAVHTIMYAYYGCSGLHIPLPFPKFWVTYMQLLQFLTMVVQHAFGRFNNWQGYPPKLSYFFIFYILTMIMLFTNYLRANTQPKKTARQQA